MESKPDAETQLIVMEAVPFGGVSEYRPLTVTIDAGRLRPNALDDLRRILADFPGKVPVVLHMVANGERARLRVGDGLRVAPVAALYAELKALLGESCIGVG